jgi:Methyltransferase domain
VEEADGPAVREFFEQQSVEGYSALKALTQELDLEAARLVNERVSGDVLSIGGVWDGFEWTSAIDSVTVLDLSARMLDMYCPPGAARVEGDLYDHTFPAARFDTVVLPLVLHHTPQGTWGQSEQRVRDALARADRWLRPGGTIVVVEYCAQPAWVLAQRFVLPLTRRFLLQFGQPLVVMYSRRFYERALGERFDDTTSLPVDPEGFDYWRWYPVFMGVGWLKVPLAVYPKLHVLVARRRLGSRPDDQSEPSSDVQSDDAAGR